ncbi:Uncharacterized protein TCM_024564 [Theobroma cacao]|uniref:Uncharacterized protein n=1 Tax=Theobroma cacao TaxID=3641 RepID=A0A061EX12_THECC|nr:Uncharacterized protein TCM_024564 [Theobroma cacao]
MLPLGSIGAPLWSLKSDFRGEHRIRCSFGSPSRALYGSSGRISLPSCSVPPTPTLLGSLEEREIHALTPQGSTRSSNMRVKLILVWSTCLTVLVVEHNEEEDETEGEYEKIEEELDEEDENDIDDDAYENEENEFACSDDD